MYQESIRKAFSNGEPPYPVGQIEAAMRCAQSDGCLDSISARTFLREVFQACTTLAELSQEEREGLAWCHGLES